MFKQSLRGLSIKSLFFLLTLKLILLCSFLLPDFVFCSEQNSIIFQLSDVNMQSQVDIRGCVQQGDPGNLSNRLKDLGKQHSGGNGNVRIQFTISHVAHWLAVLARVPQEKWHSGHEEVAMMFTRNDTFSCGWQKVPAIQNAIEMVNGVHNICPPLRRFFANRQVAPQPQVGMSNATASSLSSGTNVAGLPSHINDVPSDKQAEALQSYIKKHCLYLKSFEKKSDSTPPPSFFYFSVPITINRLLQALTPSIRSSSVAEFLTADEPTQTALRNEVINYINKSTMSTTDQKSLTTKAGAANYWLNQDMLSTLDTQLDKHVSDSIISADQKQFIKIIIADVQAFFYKEIARAILCNQLVNDADEFDMNDDQKKLLKDLAIDESCTIYYKQILNTNDCRIPKLVKDRVKKLETNKESDDIIRKRAIYREITLNIVKKRCDTVEEFIAFLGQENEKMKELKLCMPYI